MMKLVLFLLVACDLIAQIPSANVGAGEFSIIAVNDYHCINTTVVLGFPSDGYHCKVMTDWITANASTYNIKAILNLGDYHNSPAIANEVNIFRTTARDPITATGIPTVWPMGNHDFGYSQNPVTASFDASFAPAGVPVWPWNSCFSEPLLGGIGTDLTCAKPHEQYLKLDVVAAGVTYKFGIFGAGFLWGWATGTARRTWAQAILDAAEPNRQFIWATHMLMQNGQYCVDATGPNANGCTGSNPYDPTKFGADMVNDFLIHQPKMWWTFNGHVNYTPTHTTATADDGHTINSWARDGASGAQQNQLFMMMFKPASSTYTVYMWSPISANNAGWTTTTYAWTTQTKAPSTQVSGPALIRGGTVR
jgi:hypothetical protein